MVVIENKLSGHRVGESITILGWTRMEGCTRMYAFHCSECAKDPELYGDRK